MLLKCLKKQFLLLLFSLLCLSACVKVTVLPSRQEHNGYTGLSDKEKAKIDSFGQSTAGTLSIQEINGEQLRQLTQQHAYTWVSMWATWCAYCIKHLPKEVELAEKYRHKDLQLVFISSNYDVKNIEKQLRKAGYTGTAYILDQQAYQQSQKENILAFRKDVAPLFTNTSTTMPHHYLFRGKEYIYFTEGEMEAETLARLVR